MALMLLLPLAACLEPETPSPAPPATPAPIVTVAPTPAPTVSAAPTPAPTPVPATPSPSPAPKRTPSLTISTPAPPPEPGVYRNPDLGFSLHYPESWQVLETGAHTPVVRINPSGSYPVVQVDLNTMPDITTPDKYAQEYLNVMKVALTGYALESMLPVSVGDEPGSQVIFTWTSDSGAFKSKMLFVNRGTQAFQIYAMAPRTVFDSNLKTIDQALYSFRLEQPAPFGVGRNQALTVFDVSPTTLDPAFSLESVSHSYVVQVFGGLVSLDKDDKLVADLAEKWDINQGGTVYTFHLRPDAQFQNGKSVTAQDFKYSWERAADPRTKSPTVGTYLSDIVGVKDVMSGKAQEVQGVKVIDDHTLQVTIDGPKAYFLAKLTYPVAFVVDKENVGAGGEWWRTPNGTGPFRLVQWKKDELIILQRNELYHRDVAKVPYVVSRLFGGRPMTMYETGEIDVAGVGTDDIDRAKDPANSLSRELTIYPIDSVDYISFSIDKPPFDDARVRQAFMLAVDRSKIIERVLKNMSPMANGILPPGIPGYSAASKGLEFDVQKAKQLIAESKYGSVDKFPPIKLTIAGSGGDFPGSIAAILQEWKENLGVQVTVRQLDPDTFSYILKEERDEMTYTGWVADYPDPENFLDVLFHTGSQANDSGYSNPAIDALMDKARVEQDQATRLKMYQEIEQKLLDDGAVLPLWFGSASVLVKPYVKGYRLSSMGYPMYEMVTLQPH